MKPSALSRIYGETRDAKKIIVVHLGFLGDSLQLVPALTEIKRHYPQAGLHVLSSPLGCEVIRMAPCVDRAWSVDLDRSRQTWRGQWALIRALRHEKFDLAINFSGSDRTIILTALTGARVRVAHAAGRHHFWNRWVIPHWVPKQDPNQTVFEQFREMLAICGFELQPPRLDLKLDDGAVAWAAKYVPSGAVHVSVNSANPLKEWSVEHYIAFLQKLWQRQPDLPVVASAGYRERERARLRAVASGLNDSRLRLLPEDLNIAQLAGVLTRCRLHVGPDSGTMHLAVALGIPVVAYFREQANYLAWVPRGARHRVLSVPCSCVDHYSGSCLKTGKAACLAGITSERMTDVVCEQLGRPAGSGT